MRNSHARALVPASNRWNPRHASSMVSCTRSSAEVDSSVRRRATRSMAARCGIAVFSNSSCCVGTSLHLTAWTYSPGPSLVGLLLQFVQFRQNVLAVRIGINLQVNLLDGALGIDQ